METCIRKLTEPQFKSANMHNLTVMETIRIRRDQIAVWNIKFKPLHLSFVAVQLVILLFEFMHPGLHNNLSNSIFDMDHTHGMHIIPKWGF